MTTAAPDIFTNVHKGIRKALFDACTALGRAGDDVERSRLARARLRDALRFVAHHGENEDLLLLPLLRERAPACCERMERGHAAIADTLGSIESRVDTATTDELYERAAWLTTLYLTHMREEEQELQPAIRAALSVDEIAAFGKKSVERTAPEDQRMMLSWMLPAMTRVDVEAFFARLPAQVAERLRPLAAE